MLFADAVADSADGDQPAKAAAVGTFFVALLEVLNMLASAASICPYHNGTSLALTH